MEKYEWELHLDELALIEYSSYYWKEYPCGWEHRSVEVIIRILAQLYTIVTSHTSLHLSLALQEHKSIAELTKGGSMGMRNREGADQQGKSEIGYWSGCPTVCSWTKWKQKGQRKGKWDDWTWASGYFPCSHWSGLRKLGQLCPVEIHIVCSCWCKGEQPMEEQ